MNHLVKKNRTNLIHLGTGLDMMTKRDFINPPGPVRISGCLPCTLDIVRVPFNFHLFVVTYHVAPGDAR